LSKFYFLFNGEIFKARLPQPGENFTQPFKWKDEVEFEFTDKTLFMMAWTSLLPDLSPEDARNLVSLASARYPVSPDYEALHRMCPELVVGYDKDEWVFFGGSFYPWHSGHQACLQLLPDDKTCFVLPDRNPWKDLREVDPVLTTIELAGKIKFKAHQFLVPTFLFDHKKNPTIEWMEVLKQKYPSKKLSLLMGFDSFLNLSEWTRATDLLKLVDTLYVASRLENDDQRKSAESELKAIHSPLKVVFLGHHQHEGLSSTNLRKKIP
jgi:nicotinic acid mononucleotide adenylyltransferase